MKERREQLIRQKERDDAVMNFASRQAQEAILDPNLPEAYKDGVVGDAVEKILKIAEQRSTYDAKPKYGRRVKRSETIYKSK